MRKHYPLLAMLVVAGIMFCIPKGENKSQVTKPVADTIIIKQPFKKQ